MHTKNLTATIKSLAVHYHAYNVAVHDDDDNGILCWGEDLIELQTFLGVNLVDVENTRRIVASAKRRTAKAA